MPAVLLRLIILFPLFVTSLAASSKIWQGVIVRIDGSTLVIDPHYTPYASAGLYPQFCDTATDEGQLLKIDAKSIHVPFIDDVPVSPEEMLAAAKPGMRLLAFMNRKQWHQATLCVRDHGVEVGYVAHYENGELTLTRPQANWPNQMSNRDTYSAQDFPDRSFALSMTQPLRGLAAGQEVPAESLLTNGQAVMILPPQPTRLEIVPNPEQRWDATQEPLLGQYGEYEHRNNPRFNEEFYRGNTTGYFIDATLTERPVLNRPGSTEPKDMPSWLIHVPYGTFTGEHILPSRGHKTQVIIGGHFNTFPTFPAIAVGKRVTAWTYRTQLAPNWLLLDPQEALVEGEVLRREGDNITVKSMQSADGTEITLTLDDTTTVSQLGLPTNADAIAAGSIIRWYQARPTTIIAGR